ncbi:hypothetical protein OAH33_00415 [bacterium]|nr:hypothetical protein [bacterium]
MYKFTAKKKRINWLYKSYCNTVDHSLEDFIILVNKYYYRHSTSLYQSRNISDIEGQYFKVFDKLELQKRQEINVVNIGAGQGFDYRQFRKNNIKYKKYFFIEPDSIMIESFKDSARDDRLQIINSLFTESLGEEIQSLRNKVLVMNSCLHHFTQIDDFLNLIKATMNKGDHFILCHEPNNTYNKSFLSYLAVFIKLFSSLAFFRKMGLSKNNETKASKERWDKINDDLVKLGILKQSVKPLIIRRIIDYGVNTKNDWKSLNIPSSYDEGHWDPKTIIDFFGDDFAVEHYTTYRHFGDSNGNLILGFLNNAYSKIFSRSKKGSVFGIVFRKQ